MLDTDSLLYLCDFMIIPPHDYLNLFLVNSHWRNSLELNENFWKRQLCGIVYMSLNNNTKKDSKNLSFDQLYRAISYNDCKHYLKNNQFLSFKKIEQCFNSENIRPLKTKALTTLVEFHRKVSIQFQKEKLKLVRTEYLEKFEKFEFFNQDEYKCNEKIISSCDSMFMVHFTKYWIYLMKLKNRDESTRLTLLFLKKWIETKQNYSGKIANLLLNSYSLFDQMDIDPYISMLIQSLVKYFTEPTIRKNHQQRLEIYQKLIDELFLNLEEWKGPLLVSLLQKLGTIVFPLVTKEKKHYEIITIPKISRENITYLKYFLKEDVIPCLFSEFRMESGIIKQLLGFDSSLLKCFYSTLRDESVFVIYPQIRYAYKEGFDSFQELYQILETKFVKRGKPVKKLLKQMRKVYCPFYYTLSDASDLEKLFKHLEFFYHLYTCHLKKERVHEYLQKALARSFSGLIEVCGTQFVLSVLEYFKINYHIDLHKCCLKEHYVDDCFELTQLLIAEQNCPKPCKEEVKESFSIHPIVFKLIGNSNNPCTLDMSCFIPLYGETMVTIPVLIDFEETCKDKTITINSFVFSYGPPQMARYTLKKVKLKELIANPKLILAKSHSKVYRR